jgi:hypothetical protein
MPDKAHLLCDACREREATHHICYGGTGVSKHLCATCYGQSASPEELASDKRLKDAIRDGRCSYCDDPAVTGSGGFIPFLGEQLELWCEPCRHDLAEFWQRPENALPKDFGHDVAGIKSLSQHLAQRKPHLQEYMQKKVRERKSAI